MSYASECTTERPMLTIEDVRELEAMPDEAELEEINNMLADAADEDRGIERS